MSEKFHEMSTSQMLELTAAVVRAIPRNIPSDVAQEWIKNPESLARILHNGLMSPMNEKLSDVMRESEFLKLLSVGKNLTVDALDGKDILAEAKEVFAFIDSDFRSWGADEQGEATGKTAIEVHELVKDGKFVQFFNSVCDDLDKLCFTQAQIKSFCVKYRSWLRTNGYTTFFLFKSKGEYFVVGVGFRGDGVLGVDVGRFEGGSVWRAENCHRVVIPRLTG